MIPKFTLVEIVSGYGGKPTIQAWAPADWEQPGLASAHRIQGVTMTDSEYNEPVAVMREGYIRSCSAQNSETWAVGEILWGRSDGSISHTQPGAPTPLVVVGVVFADEGGGLFTIDVDVRVLPSFGELSGLSVETPEDLDLVFYNATTHVWEPRPLDYGARSTMLHPFLLMGGS